MSIEAKKTKSKAKTKVDKTSADKENVAPVKENIVAHLYKAPSVSFTEGEDLDLFNSSLAREVDQAFTPIKRSQLGIGSSSVIKKPDPETSLL